MAKKVKIKDIAKKVACSPATVSQAFHNPKLVNRKTRMEILEACEQLGYVRRTLRGKRKKIIGITGPTHHVILGDYYNAVTKSILSSAKEEGINVIIESFDDKEDTLPYMFSKKVLDGVIILGVISQEHLLMIKQENIPLLICGRPTSWIELNTVWSDGRSGIYEATKHLIGLGHRKIAYVTGSDFFDPITSDRLDGFKYALKEAEISLPEEYIIIGDFDVCKNLISKEADNILKLKPMPTAIVCESDGIAYKIYHRLTEAGLKIPKDISITGFDNLPFPPYINQVKPNITTVDINLEQLGKAAVKELLSNIVSPSEVAYRYTLPVKLIVGETTAQVK